MVFFDSETGCCAPFNPEPWDRKVITWKNRLFLHDHVISIFHVPLNFGQTVVRDMIVIRSNGALPNNPIMLSDENSPWGAEVYLEVTKPLPNERVVRLAGTYLTLAREGSFRNIRSWLYEMDTYAASEHKKIRKIYYYYPTCPKCAKLYGKQNIVLIAQVI